MARKVPAKRAATAVAKGDRVLRDRTPVEYNVVKLSEKSVEVPKAAPAPKKAVVAKKKGTKGTKGTSYVVLVKRALKDVDAPGWGVEKIVKFLSVNYPEKTNRRYIRQALNSGVERKTFVKTRLTYRLSKKSQINMSRADPKKTKPKKKSTTKKSTSKKSASKKSTSKKSTSKKSTTKKSVPKTTDAEASSSGPKKAPKKKAVIAPPPTDEQPVGEAKGVWQYYDGGWHDYVPEASSIVEGVYQEFKAAGESPLDIRAIKSGHFSYMVNFTQMDQTNTSTGTIRKIRRA